ncbi:MAG: hypothetical protein KDC14_13940, partial [Planctomycetes bacterium]|nr:hypothetical protein [Planctomycetota bacterium]
MDAPRSSSLFFCLAAGCLLGLGLLLVGVPLGREHVAGRASVTVVDRDTGLHRLDEGLYPVDARRVRWPLDALPAGEGAY